MGPSFPSMGQMLAAFAPDRISGSAHMCIALLDSGYALSVCVSTTQDHAKQHEARSIPDLGLRGNSGLDKPSNNKYRL